MTRYPKKARPAHVAAAAARKARSPWRRGPHVQTKANEERACAWEEERDAEVKAAEKLRRDGTR